MEKNDKLELIRDTGIIAIIRAKRSEQLISAADAINRGGVKVIEITMNTPGALEVIAQATRKFGASVLFGAGTVLDPETARAAILAGAGFIVAPTLNLGVIELCNRYSIPVIPGCYTPTEMVTAWQAGADMVKLFPADVGGPNFVKAILAPLPQLKIVPVGGIDLENTAEFIRCGSMAVGVGNNLINRKLVDANDWCELTQRAVRFSEEVKRGKN
jgi:2-dehydro-3-deoxyphosphogluconate aldolase / (4S)-4-hydroxy-2-oxoglutarate aldolase